MTTLHNQLALSARIAEVAPLRYTPAGLPALDLMLEHASTVQALEGVRQVQLSIRALAVAAVAERLARQAIGSEWRFSGFLSTPRRGRSVVLNIQDFQQD